MYVVCLGFSLLCFSPLELGGGLFFSCWVSDIKESIWIYRSSTLLSQATQSSGAGPGPDQAALLILELLLKIL